MLLVRRDAARRSKRCAAAGMAMVMQARRIEWPCKINISMFKKYVDKVIPLVFDGFSSMENVNLNYPLEFGVFHVSVQQFYAPLFSKFSQYWATRIFAIFLWKH